MAPHVPANQLAFGDNLDVLHLHVDSGTVDLVYLDPPFNSNATYNILFADRGDAAAAQVQAFGDTWRWDIQAASAYQKTVEGGGAVARTLRAFRTIVGTSDMLAYLSMMAPRLLELHRVLKPTGALYLHCDPTASHYLKLLLDAVFGPTNFRSEIVWKRTSGHSDAKAFGPVHDTILYYVKSQQAPWYQSFQGYDPAYIEQYYRYRDPDGRRFMSGDLSAAGLSGGGYEYEWRGVTRVWRFPRGRMETLDHEGRIFYTRNGFPRIKRYLDEAKGMPVHVWTDIEPVRSWHRERLPYPTQKPVALVDRIIKASTRPGDLVLDPFCGCGTAIEAAQALDRRWIGIDITHHATGVIKSRLTELYGPGIADTYRVIGEPTTVEDAATLAATDPYQFQSWALGLVGARLSGPSKKGGDGGVDGHLWFHDSFASETRQVVIQVKSGHVVPGYVRELARVVARDDADIGLLITMAEPTSTMRAEAADAGTATTLPGHPDRVQLRTIAQLLTGRGIDFGRATRPEQDTLPADVGDNLVLFDPARIPAQATSRARRRAKRPASDTRANPAVPPKDVTAASRVRDEYSRRAAEEQADYTLTEQGPVPSGQQKPPVSRRETKD